MPLKRAARRNDRVELDGRRYYVRPNGSAVYLYTRPIERGDSRAAAVRTASTQRLERDAHFVDEVPQRALVTRRVALPAARRTGHVTGGSHEYVYVMRDGDAPCNERALKIGMTRDVAATLRTYRRRAPNDQCIMVVECADRAAARALERALLVRFAEFRVDASEVVRVRPHEVRRALRALGAHQHCDGIYRTQ